LWPLLLMISPLRSKTMVMVCFVFIVDAGFGYKWRNRQCGGHSARIRRSVSRAWRNTKQAKFHGKSEDMRVGRRMVICDISVTWGVRVGTVYRLYNQSRYRSMLSQSYTAKCARGSLA
jgi:hypothetical protein